MFILNKKDMSEEDIKLNYITPAIQKSWRNYITMETRIIDDRINIKGNVVSRNETKKQTIFYILMRVNRLQLCRLRIINIPLLMDYSKQ